MHTRKLKSVTTFIIILCLSVVLAACGSNQSNNATNSSESEVTSPVSEAPATSTLEPEVEGATVYPLTIKHALGETIIEKKPERVVTIQWANHDVALALGVVPVGFSAANYGVQDDSGLLPWTAKKLDELGVTNPNVFQDTDGLDFEAIADANPDVILAAYSGITAEDYALLTEIAPVVAYQTSPWLTTWREQVTYTALGMGMEAEGEQLIKDVEQLIQEKAAHYPQMKGIKVVWVNFSAKDLSRINTYTPTDPRGSFLIELGMEYPESIINAIEDPTSYSLRLSAENAQLLDDADLIIGYGDETLHEAVKADPVLGKIPAVERGSVLFIGNGTPLAAAGNPNPLSIEYTIDEYLELIAAAIEKVND